MTDLQENQKERSNIIKVGGVALVMIAAIIAICTVLKVQREVTIILGSIALVVYIVNAVYSNHIIKQIDNLDVKVSRLLEKTKPK